VARTTVHFITQTFHVDSIAFFLKNEVGEYCQLVGSPLNEEMKYSFQHSFVRGMESNGMTVDLEHLRENGGDVEEIDNLIGKGWVVVAPFFLKDRLLGFLLLGRKRSEKDYTVEELELLEVFLNQTALAISRALIYRDMSLKDKQIMQAEKLAAIGELAAGIAHEIRNPLGIITGSAETVRKHENPKIRDEMTSYILEESKRINGLINTLLDFARPREPELVSCDLKEILGKTLLLLSPKAKTLGAEIKEDIPRRPLYVSIDPDQMRQAFMNLGVNALEAMPHGGVLTVAVMETARGRVVVRFSDTGKGIPKEIQAKVFDPFFTTKRGRDGFRAFHCPSYYHSARRGYCFGGNREEREHLHHHSSFGPPFFGKRNIKDEEDDSHC
jgi:signal transduction histidine kinase